MSNDEELNRRIQALAQNIANYLVTHHVNAFIDLEIQKGSLPNEALEILQMQIPLAALDIAREQVTRRTTIPPENYFKKAIAYLDRIENPHSMQ